MFSADSFPTIARSHCILYQSVPFARFFSSRDAVSNERCGTVKMLCYGVGLRRDSQLDLYHITCHMSVSLDCRFLLSPAVAGPTVWNTLPDDLSDSGRSSESLACSLKT